MKYKLKKDAVKYFDYKYSTLTEPLTFWETNNINIHALIKVNQAFITWGHVSKGRENIEIIDLKACNKNGSEFHFTIHFPSYLYMQKVNVRELMDIMQKEIDTFYFKHLINQ